MGVVKKDGWKSGDIFNVRFSGGGGGLRCTHTNLPKKYNGSIWPQIIAQSKHKQV